MGRIEFHKHNVTLPSTLDRQTQPQQEVLGNLLEEDKTTPN